MKRFVALLAIVVGACTQGDAEFDVTQTHVASFPGVPASVLARSTPGQVLTASAPITLDARSELDQFGNLGSMTLSISENQLSGTDLGLLQHVSATIATADGKMPSQPLSDVDVPAGSTLVNLPLLLSDADVLQYLMEGPITITLTVSGTLSAQPLTLTHTIVGHVDVAVDKSPLSL